MRMWLTNSRNKGDGNLVQPLPDTREGPPPFQRVFQVVRHLVSLFPPSQYTQHVDYCLCGFEASVLAS